MATPRMALDMVAESQLVEQVRKGLPITDLSQLAERLNLTQAEAATVFGIAPRTLTRRLKGKQRLTPTESDRAARVARVFAWAIHTLGSEPDAASWMHQPNRALQGERPVDLLDTDPGSTEVYNVLGRIAFGGYS